MSGFLIYSVYFRTFENPGSFKPFMIRRFGRLFPLLLFATIAYVVGLNLLVLAKSTAVDWGYARLFREPHLLEYLAPSAAEIVSTLSLTHGLGLFHKLILNYASWSISTEFYTYFLFAGVCLAFKGRRRLLAFALLAVVGFAVTAWASIEVHDCLNAGRCLDVSYDFGFARCASAFFIGALACHAARRLTFNANGLQAVGLAALALVLVQIDEAPVLALLLPAVFALLIVSLSKDRGFLAELFKRGPLQRLGERSYSIYLMHPVVLLPLVSYRGSIKGTALTGAVLVAYLGVLWVVSGWTYRFVENPSRALFNRIARRMAPPSPMGTA